MFGSTVEQDPPEHRDMHAKQNFLLRKLEFLFPHLANYKCREQRKVPFYSHPGRAGVSHSMALLLIAPGAEEAAAGWSVATREKHLSPGVSDWTPSWGLPPLVN